MNWDRCPDWKFGQVVRYTGNAGVLALVLGWEDRVDYNPTESVVILLALTPAPWAIGQVFKPYCGWWEPIE